jgi:5-methylthioadenosine/S-adenosylhomocysteine deaminase
VNRLMMTIMGVFFVFAMVFTVNQAAAQSQAVDILISGGTVVTVNSTMDVIEDGAIAVKDGIIVSIGKSNIIQERFKAKRTIDAAGKIVMPGLVNTHTHAAMVMLRGYADDLPLMQWLKEYIWPAEAKFVNRENVRIATRLAVAEMISSGTTTFNDMYFFEDDVAQVAKEAGIRVVAGETLFDGPTPNSKTPEEGLKYTEELIKKYSGDRLVTVAIAPHAPFTCSRELLKKAADLSKKYNSPLHIHLAETKDEVNNIVERYAMRPVEYLDDAGILTNRTIAAHSIQVTDKEIELFASRKTGVAHNAESNMKLAEGVAPISQMLTLQVKIGLGTDGAASNNDLNMFEEMKTAALLHKVHTWTSTALDAPTMLRLATINGARVLGLQNKTGSLEEGKEADIILIDIDQPHLVPRYNVYSLLVYAADGADVNTVIVAGKIIMMDKKLLTIDKKKCIAEIRALADQIKQRK